MGKRYLIDSNVVIDYVASKLPQNGSDFVETIFNNDFLISIIVKIEVLGFDDLPFKIQAMEEFIDMADVFTLNETIARQTILLRRKHKKIKLGDAIIAATALVHDLTIISRNTKGFKNIMGLDCVDPHEL